MIIRSILTLLVILGYKVVTTMLRTSSALVAGSTSTAQLDNSNSGYLTSTLGAQLNGNPFLLAGALILVLIAIWAPVFLKKKNTSAGIKVLGIALFLALSVPAHAYYSEKDDVEVRTIKPNWTAFLVPNRGANVDTQKQFDSKAYLGVSKVAAKTIQIPHEVLPKRGMLTMNMYIPASTLYVIERSPYSRSWTKESTRGTSKRDEATYVETAESINIDFGTNIGASIQEDDAAVFLYTWGCSSLVDQGDNAEYPSVVYARKLEEIMDMYVFHDAQSMLSLEFGKNTLEYDILHKAEIMEKVSKNLIQKYKACGISIQFFGYASPLNFDASIQTSINNKFIAQKNAEAAADQQKAIPVQSALADIEIKQSLAKALTKFDGKLTLPSLVVLPEGMLNSLNTILNPKTVAPQNPQSAPSKDSPK
ncbi:MAG: hypothetical protein WCO60_15235 [Verrucomicrobiota bacterium]